MADRSASFELDFGTSGDLPRWRWALISVPVLFYALVHASDSEHLGLFFAGLYALVVAAVLCRSELSFPATAALAIVTVGLPMAWLLEGEIPGSGRDQLLFGVFGDDYLYTSSAIDRVELAAEHLPVQGGLYSLFLDFVTLVLLFLGSITWVWVFNAIGIVLAASLLNGALRPAVGATVARNAAILFLCYPEHYLWMQTYYKESLFLLGVISIVFGVTRHKLFGLLGGALMLLVARIPFVFAVVGALAWVRARAEGRLTAGGGTALLVGAAVLLALGLVFREHMTFLADLFFSEERIARVHLPFFETDSPTLAYALKAAAGAVALLLQPFPAWGEEMNIFEGLRRIQIPAGVFWWGIAPISIHSVYLALRRRTGNIDNVLAVVCVLFVAFLAVAHMFYTGRHRYALTALLVIATALHPYWRATAEDDAPAS